MFKTRQYYINKFHEFLGLALSAFIFDAMVIIAIVIF